MCRGCARQRGGANVREGQRMAKVAPQPVICTPPAPVCASQSSICAPYIGVCAPPIGICTPQPAICAPPIGVCAPPQAYVPLSQPYAPLAAPTIQLGSDVGATVDKVSLDLPCPRSTRHWPLLDRHEPYQMWRTDAQTTLKPPISNIPRWYGNPILEMATTFIVCFLNFCLPQHGVLVNEGCELFPKLLRGLRSLAGSLLPFPSYPPPLPPSFHIRPSLPRYHPCLSLLSLFPPACSFLNLCSLASHFNSAPQYLFSPPFLLIATPYSLLHLRSTHLFYTFCFP
jgi:hypothetical protein